MPAPDGRLRRLDERIVPALRRAAHGVAAFVAAPLRVTARAEDRLAGGRIADFGVRNRTTITFLTVLIAFSGAFVHFDRYPELREQARAEAAAAARQTVREPGSTGTLAGGAPVVGPTRDVSVAQYLDGWQEALAEVPATEERAAVVSFTDFVTPEEVVSVLPVGVTPVVVQYRLLIDGAAPGSGGTTNVTDGAPVLEAEVIGGDVVASVGTVVDDLLADIVNEEAELTSMLETTDEEAFRADFENRLAELAALRNTLASGGRIVFAVVVTADGEALQALADDELVRVVDAADADADAEGTDFYGLLPTDERVVTFGQFGR